MHLLNPLMLLLLLTFLSHICVICPRNWGKSLQNENQSKVTSLRMERLQLRNKSQCKAWMVNVKHILWFSEMIPLVLRSFPAKRSVWGVEVGRKPTRPCQSWNSLLEWLGGVKWKAKQHGGVPAIRAIWAWALCTSGPQFHLPAVLTNPSISEQTWQTRL